MPCDMWRTRTAGQPQYTPPQNHHAQFRRLDHLEDRNERYDRRGATVRCTRSGSSRQHGDFQDVSLPRSLPLSCLVALYMYANSHLVSSCWGFQHLTLFTLFLSACLRSQEQKNGSVQYKQNNGFATTRQGSWAWRDGSVYPHCATNHRPNQW